MAVRSALVSGISLSLGCGAGAVAVSTMRRDIVDLQVDLSTSVRETHSQINPKIEPIYNPTVRLCARERERAPRSEELPRNSVLITAHMTSLLTRSHTHNVMPAHNCRPARWKRRSKQHSATSLNRGTRA